MDLLSIAGVVLGFTAILGGNFLEGGHLSGLYNGPAAVIVLGGTFGAAMLQTPLPVFKRAFHIVPWIFFPPKVDIQSGINKVIGWSLIARKEGLLGLETVAETEEDAFAKKGLQLLVDGGEPVSIRQILEVELFVKESRDMHAAKVFDCMGGYSPTIGIIGAVMGLIHVMGNLADPSRLGPGIATAFVATIYGVGLANLLLLPVANKLKSMVQQQAQARELFIEGVIAIAEGENPRTIEFKLYGYIEDAQLSLTEG
ncbi:MAG: flagellar motor protein [Pseudomonadales bacterium]|nr:flagellar motor protein [Pseudomonadales bacterium]